MADLQKFNFDTFVVGSDVVPASLEVYKDFGAESEEKIMPIAANETVFSEGEKVIASADAENLYSLMDEKDANVSSDKKVVSIEKNVTPSVNDDSVFIVSEFNQKIEDAGKEGYQRGLLDAKQTIENENKNLLENISSKIGDLISKIDVFEDEVKKSYLDLMKEGLQKLVPGLLEEKAEEVVANFVKENFENIKNEEKLVFYVNSKMIGKIQEVVSELARSNDFEGKVAIHKDDNLAISDCVIKWNKGGVERKNKAIIDKIETM